MTKVRWTEKEILQVCAKTMVDIRTLRRFLEGKKPVHASSAQHIIATAKKLGLKIPRNGR